MRAPPAKPSSVSTCSTPGAKRRSYSERERAALEWTEAVTRVADGHVPDEVFASARDHFSEEELVNLTIAVIATNGWNRLNIAFRPEVGEYRPGMFDQPKTAQAAM
jgi:alkylhydroperoxidase family enzyme